MFNFVLKISTYHLVINKNYKRRNLLADNISYIKLYFLQQGVFFFSTIWSIGATLESNGRSKFDILFRGLLEKEFPAKVLEALNYPKEIGKPEKQYIFTIPKEGSVYDYRFIKEVISA